jgi:hypothetical protein
MPNSKTQNAHKKQDKQEKHHFPYSHLLLDFIRIQSKGNSAYGAFGAFCTRSKNQTVKTQFGQFHAPSRFSTPRCSGLESPSQQNSAGCGYAFAMFGESMFWRTFFRASKPFPPVPPQGQGFSIPFPLPTMKPNFKGRAGSIARNSPPSLGGCWDFYRPFRMGIPQQRAAYSQIARRNFHKISTKINGEFMKYSKTVLAYSGEALTNSSG